MRRGLWISVLVIGAAFGYAAWRVEQSAPSRPRPSASSRTAPQGLPAEFSKGIATVPPATEQDGAEPAQPAVAAALEPTPSPTPTLASRTETAVSSVTTGLAGGSAPSAAPATSAKPVPLTAKASPPSAPPTASPNVVAPAAQPTIPPSPTPPQPKWAAAPMAVPATPSPMPPLPTPATPPIPTAEPPPVPAAEAPARPESPSPSGQPAPRSARLAEATPVSREEPGVMGAAQKMTEAPASRGRLQHDTPPMAGPAEGFGLVVGFVPHPREEGRFFVQVISDTRIGDIDLESLGLGRFQPFETPTVTIECLGTKDAPCDPARDPAQDPQVDHYQWGNLVMARDAHPTEPGYQIGTFTGSARPDSEGRLVTQSEVIFFLAPGTNPGRYRIAVQGAELQLATEVDLPPPNLLIFRPRSPTYLPFPNTESGGNQDGDHTGEAGALKETQ